MAYKKSKTYVFREVSWMGILYKKFILQSFFVIFLSYFMFIISSCVPYGRLGHFSSDLTIPEITAAVCQILRANFLKFSPQLNAHRRKNKLILIGVLHKGGSAY